MQEDEQELRISLWNRKEGSEEKNLPVLFCVRNFAYFNILWNKKKTKETKKYMTLINELMIRGRETKIINIIRKNKSKSWN